MTSLIIQLQAKKPVRKAAIKPVPRYESDCPWSKNVGSIRSLAIFPNISGTTIRNEKRAALARSTFSNTEVDMVAPDLDIPGSIAIAWAIPIRKASFQLTDLPVDWALSAK